MGQWRSLQPELNTTRACDRKELAIEHTMIQPFAGDKEDFARFAREFLPSEEDKSLSVPERAIYQVPIGTLQKGQNWSQVAKAPHEWLRDSSSQSLGGRLHGVIRISVLRVCWAEQYNQGGQHVEAKFSDTKYSPRHRYTGSCGKSESCSVPARITPVRCDV